MTKYYTWSGLALAALLWGCAPAPAPKTAEKPTIVVTYSILGDLVNQLAGEKFTVKVLLPNGLDPHEWEPSAQDIAALQKAALVVRNGLGLEGGMEGALKQAADAGVPQFVASDHITVRHVKAGEGLPTGDADQAEGAADPHLWLNPRGMASVVEALATDLKTRFSVDLTPRATDLTQKLTALDTELKAQAQALPADHRLLVTGHESMGYFAEAYGLTLVGAIVPSLNSQAEVSAQDLANLKKVIVGRKVRVIFTETGTPPKVAQALGQEVGLKVIEITTHALPAGGGYFDLLRGLGRSVLGGLAAP